MRKYLFSTELKKDFVVIRRHNQAGAELEQARYVNNKNMYFANCGGEMIGLL